MINAARHLHAVLPPVDWRSKVRTYLSSNWGKEFGEGNCRVKRRLYGLDTGLLESD